MQRQLSRLLIISLIIALSTVSAFGTAISINDQYVKFSKESGTPFIDSSNRTQVPFRATMEQFGGTVNWDVNTQTAIAEKDGIKVEVPIGVPYIIKNGQKISNDTTAHLKDDRTYLPIREVLEAFGASVSWKASCKTVLVYTDPIDKMMKVHFINVGQGDAIFIDYGDYEALIDGGSTSKGLLVANYIRPFVDGNLDLVIATHVHEDHIGGLKSVLSSFQVSQIIDSGDTTSTAAFNEYLAAVSSEPDCVYTADNNLRIDLGGGAYITIIDVVDGDRNANNNSVITLLQYNSFKLLLPGDAEEKAEAAFQSYVQNVNVLKAGHHGSKTASSYNLLTTIKPEVIIISAGLPNRYNHPHVETLERFASIGAKIYGTYKSGNIVLTTNGITFSLNTSSSVTITDTTDKAITPIPEVPYQPNVNNDSDVTKAEALYIGNSNTKKFHKLSCRYTDDISAQNIIYLKQRMDAVTMGYIPCKVCNP